MSTAWRAAVVVAAACLAAACAPEIPASLQLTVVADDGTPTPDHVRVAVFDDRGIAFAATTFAVASGASRRLGTVVIFPQHKDAQALRIFAQGTRDTMVVSQGTTVGRLIAGQQSPIQVTLSAAAAPDRDGDGVPDAIDNCPAVPNPQQQDARHDGTGDACRSDAGGPDAADGDVGDEDARPPGDASMRSTGAPCSSAIQCETGFCVGDVCCESACTDTCRSCALPGRAGQCAPVPAGQVDPRAGCMVELPGSCGLDGTCDGAGACRKHPAGTECRAGSCSGSDRILPGTCDGMGSCAAGRTQTCAPYACDGATCGQSCGAGQPCANGVACVNGSCGKQPLGAACSAGAACNSGNCIDGVCCDTAACSGPCRACNLPGSTGSCQNIAANAQPRATGCESEAPTTCGRSGKCDGAGGCQLHPAGTPCGAQSCISVTDASGSACNGSGICLTSGVHSCGIYLCGPTGCRTSCAADTDCAATAYCLTASQLCVSKVANGGLCTDKRTCASGSCANGHCCQVASCASGSACVGAGGTCVVQKALGKTCSSGSECESRFCADGVCCESACTETCRSCDQTPGRCEILDYGRDSNATTPCNTPKRCSNGGTCR
jgi:hypothetical protein